MRVVLGIYERFAAKITVDQNTGCWMWQGSRNTDGYGQMWVSPSKAGAHRLAWELHVGPIPDAFCVCHKCDTPACCNPSHLFLGTVADNNRDKDRKGRGGRRPVKGAAHVHAKLTEDAVRDIRASTDRYADIAKRHGISTLYVPLIRRRLRWTHVA